MGGWEDTLCIPEKEPIREGRTRQYTTNIEHPLTQRVTTNKQTSLQAVKETNNQVDEVWDPLWLGEHSGSQKMN